MGYYDESCLICGLPCCNPLDNDKYKWLNNCIGINEWGKIELLKYDGAGEFNNENLETYHNNTIYQLHKLGYITYNKLPRGVVCHKKCYVLLIEKLNYKINFHDIWPMYSQLENEEYTKYNINNFQSCVNDLKFLNYYPNGNHYLEQYLDTDKLIGDGYEWMLLDPTFNEKNAERILSIWKPIILNFQFSNININNHDCNNICFVCGLQCCNRSNDKNCNWLNDIIGISENGYIEDLIYDGSGKFTNSFLDTYYNITLYKFNKTKNYSTFFDKKTRGLVCHKNCYILLDKYLHYKINFHDIWPLYFKDEDQLLINLNILTPLSYHNDLRYLNYLTNDRYYQQNFNYQELINDGFSWMLIDPLICEKNRNRIINIWSKFMLNCKFATLSL